MNKHFAGGKFVFGSETDYMEIEADGSINLYGDATMFDDLLGDITQVKSQGSGVSLNNTESSLEYTATANLNDYSVINYQVPHGWKVGSDVFPHLHFWQDNDNAPNFLLRYRWQINSGAKTTSWTDYKCNTLVFEYTSGTLNQIAHGGGITPPEGAGLSDILQIRIFRDTGNTSTVFAGADPYTGAVGITSADVHIEKNRLGSRQEYVE